MTGAAAGAETGESFLEASSIGAAAGAETGESSLESEDGASPIGAVAGSVAVGVDSLVAVGASAEVSPATCAATGNAAIEGAPTGAPTGGWRKVAFWVLLEAEKARRFWAPEFEVSCTMSNVPTVAMATTSNTRSTLLISTVLLMPPPLSVTVMGSHDFWDALDAIFLRWCGEERWRW